MHQLLLYLTGLRSRRDPQRAARLRGPDPRGGAPSLPGRLSDPAEGEEVQGVLQDRQALRMGPQPHFPGEN